MAALIIWYGSPASTDDYHCLPTYLPTSCVPRLTYRRLLPHGCCTHTYRLPARYLTPTNAVVQLMIPAALLFLVDGNRSPPPKYSLSPSPSLSLSLSLTLYLFYASNVNFITYTNFCSHQRYDCMYFYESCSDARMIYRAGR